MSQNNNLEKKPAAWGYTGEIGPCTWHENYPSAGGKRQSPIDINTASAEHDASLKPLNIHYDSHMCSSLTNNGHTFCVSVKSDGCNLSGGPLADDKYRLLQFHSHWGSDDTKGAEHTIDGHQHAAELHLVHWNTDKFESPGKAILNDKGIAVLTVFIKAGKEHKGWGKFLDQFKDIVEVHGSCNMKEDFNPQCLLPENQKDFWTYEGSLTTPPCYESVQFIIFKEEIEMSKEQLDTLRSLSTAPGSGKGDCCKGNLVNNFRPVQSLNGRVVKASFQS